MIPNRPLPHTLVLLLLLCGLIGPASADERTLTPEQLEALQSDGELSGDSDARPAKLPDLTKGEPAGAPGKHGEHIWPLGPTGMFGHMVGGPKVGDQIEVAEVQRNSPAHGKMRWGDVIIGVAGKKFVAGQNMGMVLGKAIIEAEREVNKGQLKLLVWRDKNFIARNGKKDIAGKDIEKLIEDAESDNSLYDWKPEGEREKEVRSSNFDEFPIDAEVLEITLQLEVMPDYSDTSPYDCPKAKRILENGWKVLEGQFEAGKVRANRRGTLAALALVASGKPEHRALIREWVRSPNAKNWHPSMEGTLDIMKPGGFVSWRMSFDALDAAIYYDATGDDYVLPAIREYAVYTAKGQAGGGSWGHTFAWPVFNGGKLHGMNPGYGAINAAGNRCFMLLALAKKHGIEHPEIDQAIERSSVFFGSYYEKGAVPYGHHGAAASDDSNGKNVGVAFAFKLLGDKKRAGWFAQMSSHASFTRRGGHGSGYLWHYTPWAATMLGPEITIASHRNLRWRFTLCRQFDGSFTCHSNYGKENLRNPTATYMMHYSAPMKQTLFSGKDADESMYWKKDEFAHLLTIAQGQFNDPQLLEKAGPPVRERPTDEVFNYLGVFKPKMRRYVAQELGKRYQAGEKDIVPRLVKLLSSDNPRVRAGACRGLEACGPDATLQYMSAVAKLLKDKNEFVRIRAASAMAKASSDTETQIALLKATVANDETKTKSPNSLGAFMQSALFKGETALAKSPFEAGYDDALVQAALEKLITLDPAGNRPVLGSQKKVWDKQTAVRIAGPLVFAAEQEQIADQMFSSRRTHTLAFLTELGYHEAVESSFYYLRQREDIPRQLRAKVFFKRGTVEPDPIMSHPHAGRPYLERLTMWLADKPLAVAPANSKEDPPTPVYALIDAIRAAEDKPSLPRLADSVEAQFQAQLAEAGDDQARLALCRAELADPKRKNFFRKLGAMRYLAKTLGGKAMPDVLAYLGHDYWRLNELAHRLAVELSTKGGEAELIAAFDSIQTHQQVAALAVLGESGSDAARKWVKQSLAHAKPQVRGAAAEALVAIDGTAALGAVFAQMNKAVDTAELERFEEALLSRHKGAEFVDEVRKRCIAQLADTEPPLRHSLYWVIGNLGGAESIAALQDVLEECSDADFAAIINALSYCPDAETDKVMLGIVRANLKENTKRAEAAAAEGVRRMVVGEKGYATRSTKEQLDYAERLLDMTLDPGTIAYLGRIRTGRCAFILQKAMRRGATTDAAQAIIDCTSDLSKATDADRKLAESALVDTIEFIEVTYLRGGVEAKLGKHIDVQRAYIKWKAISAQAGKNLLKLTKMKKPEPLPEFDDTDLDF